MRFTTQKAALCDALLNGDTLSIMDAFKRFGMTNLPREISRQIERSFEVIIIRTPIIYNKCGQSIRYYTYELLENPVHMPSSIKRKHLEGINMMRNYINSHKKD